ncbi:MAG: hypothetical protein EXR59_06060 [Dehalococcoidia bacterium]|nr:hypothetical protein [Dehalococcoidia bacterium]
MASIFRIKVFQIALVLGISLVATSLFISHTQAQSSITIVSESVQNGWPDKLDFTFEVQSAAQINDARLNYSLGSGRSTAFTKGEVGKLPSGNTKVTATIKTGGTSYQPPGTLFTYWLSVGTPAGDIEGAHKDYLYLDSRFDWKTDISKENVTILYHGPVRARAQLVLDSIAETKVNMSPVLGVSVDSPVRIILYNNVVEMQPVLPFVSVTLGSTLITEGQAYGEQGVTFVLGQSNVRGVASHEFTHLMVDKAAGTHGGLVPSWLNEGLAEFGNLDPGVEYDKSLANALRQDHILPISQLAARQGNAEDAILLYGQGRSIVKFMVNTYGPDKMAQIFKNISSGDVLNKAVTKAYGFNMIKLENNWRATLGLPPITDTGLGLAPTQAPIPTVPLLGSQPTQAAASPTPKPSANGGGGGCTALGEHASTDVMMLALPAMLASGAIFVRRRKRNK